MNEANIIPKYSKNQIVYVDSAHFGELKNEHKESIIKVSRISSTVWYFVTNFQYEVPEYNIRKI